MITWFYPEDAVSTGIFSYQAGWNRNILGLGLCHSVTVCDICSMVSCVISDLSFKVAYCTSLYIQCFACNNWTAVLTTVHTVPNLDMLVSKHSLVLILNMFWKLLTYSILYFLWLCSFPSDIWKCHTMVWLFPHW